MEVKQIQRNDCEEFILNIHYAKRWPSISYAFGLYVGNKLDGIVTYGTPPSSPLRRGIAGDDYIKDVLELNRLCLRNNKKNQASYLVGNSLKKLPKNKIIVSYADTSQDHLGIVYQATNFIYCGLSAKRTDWKVKGLEHLHGQTIADKFRGVKNRSKAIREYYGDDFYLNPRPRKHRYLYFHGSKTYKKNVLAKLRYKIQPYPKAVIHKE
jgi:Ni,Fe-hydrogenase III small subunit